MLTGYYWKEGKAKQFAFDYWKVPSFLLEVPLCFTQEITTYFGFYTKERGNFRRTDLCIEQLPKEFLTALLLLGVNF